jgi:hypothetical protein
MAKKNAPMRLYFYRIDGRAHKTFAHSNQQESRGSEYDCGYAREIISPIARQIVHSSSMVCREDSETDREFVVEAALSQFQRLFQT